MSSTTAKQMSASQIISALTWCEVDGKLTPVCRQVLRDERFALTAAVRSGDGADIAAAAKEAIRVAEMWGVRLA
jgi:hypothetical protein